jgi:prolipoprotein diacylglyceryl transferase
MLPSLAVLQLSLPSPSSGDFELGPFTLRAYGLILAIAVLVAIWMAQREMRRRGIDTDLAGRIALWTVPLGVIGARLYHVATDWSRFSDDFGAIPAIWNGGLGIYGALAGGALGATIGARRTGVPVLVLWDCLAPALAIAQAIGRLGNWFNQELFGGPTDLPWGLEIDPANRPAAYIAEDTFHPTFLYEALWSLVVLAVVLAVARRSWRRLPAGAIFVLYLGLYSFGRFFIEGLRVDPAHEIGPLRLNQAVAAVIVVVCALVLVRMLRRARPPVRPRRA